LSRKNLTDYLIKVFTIAKFYNLLYATDVSLICKAHFVTDMWVSGEYKGFSKIVMTLRELSLKVYMKKYS
jgi:hypothetical protein